MKQKDRLLDKVTVANLDTVLKMVGIALPHETIDKIIDLVEIIEEKGDNVTVNDILLIQKYWKNQIKILSL